MGEEYYRKKFIDSNSKILTKSTVIGIELVISLFSKGLIDDEQKDMLSNHFTPNITRAVILYTSIANKWNQSQFQEFQKILQETGNLQALQVFTNAGADIFLTNEQVQVLRSLRDKSETGCYEGLSLEDELVANKVFHLAKGDNGLFNPDGMFELSDKLDRKDVIPLVNLFTNALKHEIIWWNGKKQTLPKYHIPRKIAKTIAIESADTIPSGVETKSLLEDSEDLILLVDPPGMGKSSEMTFLEQNLRSKIPSNRVIVRINLNEVQRVLLTITESESALNVLAKLAPFLPHSSLRNPQVSVFVLLDGLDEVCPRYQRTMLNLLHILTAPPRNPDNLRIFLTTRPHLRAPVESAFHLESWSLLPLTVKEQDDYIRATGVSSDGLINFRDKLPSSLEGLLSNPLMLSMFADVLKSGGTLSAADINVFDLYSRFLDSKHKLHVTQKEGMREEDNYTEIRLESMLTAKLPQYHRIAIEELIHADELRELTPNFTDSRNAIVHTAPSGLTKTDLLSVGLVVQRSADQMVFKHRSFAEFFYARLLTHEDSLQQRLRDIFFGFIYGGRSAMGNVEAFMKAALSKRQAGDNPEQLLLPLTHTWLLFEKNVSARCQSLENFVEGLLFPLLSKDVLLSFVVGESRYLWESLCVLLASTDTFSKLFGWMTEHREWSRRELLKIKEGDNSYPEPVARLMAAIALQFEDQELLTEKEVGVALRSCDHRLITIVAQINTEGTRSKWDFVEGHLSGRCQLRNLLMNADEEDFSVMIEDFHTAWKAVENFSCKELASFVTNNETRVTDVVGRRPAQVCVALGEELLSPMQLAEFRSKFGDAEGKTVFELKGADFGVDYLWKDLLEETQSGNLSGPVRVALREAVGKRDLWWLIQQIEDKVCEASSDEVGVLGVVDFVFGGGESSLWDNVTSLHTLPFMLRYFGRELHPHHVSSILQRIKQTLGDEESLLSLLRSLIFSVCYQGDNPSCFSILKTFITQNLTRIPQHLKPLAEVFIRSEGKELIDATPAHFLVRDVSVGGVFLALTQHQQKAISTNFAKKTWVCVVRDIIQFTAPCDLRFLLEELRLRVQDEKLLKEVLTSRDVLHRWAQRIYSKDGKEGVRSFLSFYFSVFGLNCEWMKVVDGVAVGADTWDLIKNLPVEIATALGKEQQWTHLIPPFQEMLREFLRAKNVVNIAAVGGLFGYSTENGWEALLKLILVDGGDEFLQKEGKGRSDIRCVPTASLIRTFIRMFGVDWTAARLENLWSSIPSHIKHNGDCLETAGSLLHSAIELGEMEEVKRRAWPGLVTWKNPYRKNALDVAREKLGDLHPITILINKLISNKRV